MVVAIPLALLAAALVALIAYAGGDAAPRARPRGLRARRFRRRLLLVWMTLIGARRAGGGSAWRGS